MKICKPLLLFLLLLAAPLFLFSQQSELINSLKLLSEKVQPVEAKKYNYGQRLSWNESSPVHIQFESNRSDEKGKTITLVQEVNLRFLDEGSVQRDNVKDLLVVRVFVKGKDKFVKNIKDDELDKYDNELEFIANDVDNARDIEEGLKQSIALAKKLPAEIPIPTDFENQMKWLTEQVSRVDVGDVSYDQKMQREENHPSRFLFESASQDKKDSNTEQWAFNLIDLNAKDVKLKLDKTKLYVNVTTAKDKNYIRYHKNTKQESYQEDFKIYVSSIEQGQAMAEVISILADESTKRFAKLPGNMASKGTTSTSLTELVQEVSINDDRYAQKILQEDCMIRLTSNYSKKEDSVSDEYKVSAADLDPNSVKIEVSKKDVMVTASVFKKEKFVQLIRNGAPEDFKNEFQIRATDIENARALLEALPAVIQKCKGKNDCKNPQGNASALMNTIASHLGEVTIKSTVYTQSLRPLEGNAEQWEYSRTESSDKKTKKETFIFNISDLNLKATDYQVGKEAIGITLQTKKKEEIIKYLVDDKANDFKKEVEWLVKDVEALRSVRCALDAAGGM
jgi:hypothetical protein